MWCRHKLDVIMFGPRYPGESRRVCLLWVVFSFGRCKGKWGKGGNSGKKWWVGIENMGRRGRGSKRGWGEMRKNQTRGGKGDSMSGALR